MDDCNKLAPTKMVNQYQFSLTYIPNSTLNMMKVPAIALINLFIIIFDFNYIVLLLKQPNGPVKLTLDAY